MPRQWQSVTLVVFAALFAVLLFLQPRILPSLLDASIFAILGLAFACYVVCQVGARCVWWVVQVWGPSGQEGDDDGDD